VSGISGHADQFIPVVKSGQAPSPRLDCSVKRRFLQVRQCPEPDGMSVASWHAAANSRRDRAADFSLARESEKIAVSTGVAVDAGKSVVRVTALDESRDRALFHSALKSPRLAKLSTMALHTLPQGACARVSGAIHAPTLERTATLYACPSSLWPALPSHT